LQQPQQPSTEQQPAAQLQKPAGPKMIRCRVCGYIMRESDLKDRCPACGAPRTAFEAYIDPMGAHRRNILRLHLHPIAVHFPTTFSVAAFVFSVAYLIFRGEIRDLLLSTTQIVAFFLPILVIATFVLGWTDGLLRFRKIGNSQILKTKIVYASLLLAVSIALAIVVWVGKFDSAAYTAASIVLGAGAVIFSYLLGLLGMSISAAAFPGK
jgi:uncharacterized membrane protein